MCVGGKDFLSILLSPAGLVRAGAKAMGYDSTTATAVSGDLIGHALGAKKEQKEEQKTAQANQDAWNRYYASQQNKPASPFTTRNTTNGGNL